MIIEILSFLFPVVNMYGDQNAQFVPHTHSELFHIFATNYCNVSAGF